MNRQRHSLLCGGFIDFSIRRSIKYSAVLLIKSFCKVITSHTQIVNSAIKKDAVPVGARASKKYEHINWANWHL